MRDLAAEAGCTPAQLALAWLLARPERIVPPPGNPPPHPPRRQPRRPVDTPDPGAVRGRRRLHPGSVRRPGPGSVPPGAVSSLLVSWMDALLASPLIRMAFAAPDSTTPPVAAEGRLEPVVSGTGSCERGPGRRRRG
ncbi:hypothetical protein ACFQ7B_19240 [Streptomyces erythrochromogenes]|uniref:hypothetical protein n=1 Tax=Streptomyces erythrochromogenes TaxID=285574 RepID=UPI0036CB113E